MKFIAAIESFLTKKSKKSPSDIPEKAIIEKPFSFKRRLSMRLSRRGTRSCGPSQQKENVFEALSASSPSPSISQEEKSLAAEIFETVEVLEQKRRFDRALAEFAEYEQRVRANKAQF
ncbi:hypothetical protein L596_012177 [Steinernema carpocapsae]|uniref:Uncharacterized protein n=1 Tax=Steinernema carpocapsae TaxID=34508 RepID=A0A4U5NX29_STECR|nr:hypothetical protein L596_012177 [Steinernema carpocapsae]